MLAGAAVYGLALLTAAGAAALRGRPTTEQEAADVRWVPASTPLSAVAA
jgi:hypothetical protein